MFMFRPIQSLIPSGTGVGTGVGTGSVSSNTTQLVPLCELRDIASIRQLGSGSNLSPISSKTNVKQQRIVGLNAATATTTNASHGGTDISSGDCQPLASNSPAPSHSSPTMVNQQPSALSSSSSSSDSGVRLTLSGVYFSPRRTPCINLSL